MTDWRSDRIGSALCGRNPTVLRRLDAGFRRVNLEILGNRSDPATALGPRHDALRADLAMELDRLREAQ